MFCPYCGANIDGSPHFCKGCARSLHTPAASPAVYPSAQPQVVPLQPIHNVPTAYTRALTSAGRSFFFLTAVLAYTISAVLRFYVSISFENTQLLSQLELLDGDLSRAVSTLSAVTPFIDLIPCLLTVIGLWTAYGACHSRSARISTGGFSCIKAAVILRIIFSSLFFAASTIGCIALIYQLPNIGWTVLSVAVVGFVIYLLYQSAILSGLNSASDVGRTGVTSHSAPIFLMIVCIFTAVFALCLPVLSATEFAFSGTFRGFLTALLLPYRHPLRFIASILSALSATLFSVVTLWYRNGIRRAMS